MTGRFFTKLLLSFVLVLCLGTAVLDFSFRNIVDHSLHQEARVAQMTPGQEDRALHILRRDLLLASLFSLALATLVSAWIARRSGVTTSRLSTSAICPVFDRDDYAAVADIFSAFSSASSIVPTR